MSALAESLSRKTLQESPSLDVVAIHKTVDRLNLVEQTHQ